ncbi:UDP-N-acetylmuramate--L-alanine ligase [Clostridium folliculivorans]|uniref:UDP-N-acetylmuramate--L-alanine ligase n=1 Tax=Clostridium folliculivorans TaxID=2886038 RepID=A0A9W6DCY7_9CLOT|nr:UDP-N-acetylmuramate--L-alanine ligase [Clostridium folliculivorans]GKU27466.1 UDP-N-acetylmuramate--L-alanine ligase [Clostridium folliculivorans]GKU32316.1 UDP-N-acetylmuramate--L-alanine ligase [Clostridium folliculivorans]
MENKIKVHFMGICGSGAAPIAIIAKNNGFDVSGCDLNVSGYYKDALLENNIEILKGHALSHIENIDILAISPAILDISPNNPEILEAEKRGILMTWQEFSAKYIQKEKFVISIAGTHGKSTTTVLMGLVLENGGLDPIVEAGTTFKRWGGGYRLGKSKYFVCEADEFNNNFLNYSPSIAVINNIEMDHPEFFKDITDVKNSFKNFIKKLTGPKILIINEDSAAISEVICELKDWLKEKGVKVIGYYIDNKLEFPFDIEYKAELVSTTPDSSTFKLIYGDKENIFNLGLIGKHNVMNSLGVLITSLELGVDIDLIKNSFENFKGIGRRLELIADIDDIKIFDDFAHHPTAVATTLDSINLSYPGKKVFAIFEPHQLSRTKLFFNEFAVALRKADRVIITKPFLGREANKNIEPIDLNMLCKEIDINKADYIENSDEICSTILNEAKSGDLIIVFGAGDSYKLSRKVISILRKNSTII